MADSVINMNCEFNVFGQRTFLVGTVSTSFPIIHDAPKEMQPIASTSNWWKGLGLVVVGAVAVCVLAAPAAAVGGAAIALGVAVGETMVIIGASMIAATLVYEVTPVIVEGFVWLMDALVIGATTRYEIVKDAISDASITKSEEVKEGDSDSKKEEESKPSNKPYKNNKEANKQAQKQGYDDAHDLKEAYVGKKNVSKYDMKYDTKTGEIYLESKDGTIQIPTGLYHK